MKIWLILFMFFSLNIFSQETDSERAYNALDSIIARGKLRGVNIEPLINDHLDTIVVLTPNAFPILDKGKHKKVIGEARYVGYRGSKVRRAIRVSNTLLGDFQVLERVIAHELGHTIKLKHCCTRTDCSEIMSIGVVTNTLSKWYYAQFDPIESILFWDNYFNDIVKNNGLKVLD